MSWYKKSQSSNFFYSLSLLRPKIAQSAQNVYDDWAEDDMISGSGGICDEIANAIADVIHSNIDEVETVDGGQEGDDHAWVIAHNGTEVYGVDIPHQIYERGGGYNWVKIPGVTFQPNHVEIRKLDININNLER